MTTKEYIARLKHLSDSNKEILQRVTKLSKLVPAEGEPEEGEDNRIELGEEIHAGLKELESEFELFKQGAEDFTDTSGNSQRRRDRAKEKERVLLITQIERFGEDLKDSRGHFRRAQLQAKRNEEEAQRKRARESLFASIDSADNDRSAAGLRRGGKEGNATQDDVILSAAGDVTAGLRRTHQLMTQELEKSRFAHETLQKSTAALNSLNESYSGLDDLLKSSRSLISTLVSSQKSDTWYLETALKIAVATLLWLIFRRWFYGPFYYFLYSPLRFMLGAVHWVFNLTLGVLTGTVFKLGEDTQAGLAVSSATRAPLIVKPSASGGLPKRRPEQGRPNVKVGLGGGGEAEGRSPGEKAKDDETLPERVAKMAENARQKEEQYGEGAQRVNQEGAAGGAVAGDGTILRERGPDEKPNPKKRMMEEPPAPKGEGNKAKDKDEL